MTIGQCGLMEMKSVINVKRSGVSMILKGIYLQSKHHETSCLILPGKTPLDTGDIQWNLDNWTAFGTGQKWSD